MCFIVDKLCSREYFTKIVHLRFLIRRIFRNDVIIWENVLISSKLEY